MGRIVIVEDDRDIRELIELILGEDGYPTESCSTGAEGLAACRREPPGLVLLDVTMPGELSGLDVCRALRAEPPLADVPVVLLTARAREEDVTAGYRAGATDYLVKPFHPLDLSRRVEDLLGPPPA